MARIVGGLHLTGVAERDLQRACDALRAMPTLERVYASHCTGETAFLALAWALGTGIVRTAPAGTVIS